MVQSSTLLSLVLLIILADFLISNLGGSILAHLRDYEAMQIRQTIAGIAAGIGGITGVLLAFRWRQRRGLQEKKKRP